MCFNTRWASTRDYTVYVKFRWRLEFEWHITKWSKLEIFHLNISVLQAQMLKYILTQVWSLEFLELPESQCDGNSYLLFQPIISMFWRDLRPETCAVFNRNTYRRSEFPSIFFTFSNNVQLSKVLFVLFDLGRRP